MKKNQKLREQIQQYHRALPWITIKEFLMIILCTIPYAIAVNQILVPHAIVGGGITGLCEISISRRTPMCLSGSAVR